MEELTPREIVAELEKYIVGQEKAKRAVAIAMRNRYRRRRLPEDLQEEVLPKNILMIGPTGVGKTEIARRIARLAKAPFIKVEATKFTEVGYVGRDAESMVRDLVEVSLRQVKAEKMLEVQDRAKEMAQQRLLDILAPLPQRSKGFGLPNIFGFSGPRNPDTEENYQIKLEEAQAKRREVERALKFGEMENVVIEVELEDNSAPMLEVFSGAGVEEMGINFQDIFGEFLPKKTRKRKTTVAKARTLLAQEEAAKLLNMDEVTAEAVSRAENMGIIFLDEIDKIAGREGSLGPDVSREGVQRDSLPIVEGCTVNTKYGPVKTDHILFIAAGAFHVSKPSDLIPELQGRFPIRVELDTLTEEDFRRILTEPSNALLRQYKALLATEGVQLEFTEDGIGEIARLAVLVNERTENIGARRLHTVLERLLEDVSFRAEELMGQTVVIDRDYVAQNLADVVTDRDLSRFIL